MDGGLTRVQRFEPSTRVTPGCSQGWAGPPERAVEFFLAQQSQLWDQLRDSMERAEPRRQGAVCVCVSGAAVPVAVSSARGRLIGP